MMAKGTRCKYCDMLLLSKPKMAHEIMKMVGHKEEKSIYNAGTFTREEMFSIYRYIIKAQRGREGRK